MSHVITLDTKYQSWHLEKLKDIFPELTRFLQFLLEFSFPQVHIKEVCNTWRKRSNLYAFHSFQLLLLGWCISPRNMQFQIWNLLCKTIPFWAYRLNHKCHVTSLWNIGVVHHCNYGLFATKSECASTAENSWSRHENGFCDKIAISSEWMALKLTCQKRHCMRSKRKITSLFSGM